METTMLKNAFHQLIDEFENIEVLTNFYLLIYAYLHRDTPSDVIDTLNQEQQKRLQNSLKQSYETDKLVPHSQMKTEIKQWLTK